AWSLAYGIAILGCGWLGWRLLRGGSGDAPLEAAAPAEAQPGATPTLGERALWFSLAACGSGLLLAVTNQLSLNVAVVPFPLVLMLAVLHHDARGKLRARTWWFAWSVIAAVVWVGLSIFILPSLKSDGTTVARARNFYGVLRVLDDAPGDENPMRSLRHGHIIHGSEFLDSLRRDLPTSYYASGSGVDIA